VAELGEERGLDGGAGIGPRIGISGAFTFQVLKRGNGLSGNLLAFAVRAGPPRLPVEAEELVEQEGAFKSQRDKREIGQRVHLESSLDYPIMVAIDTSGAKAPR
jgi:hypothetical protein